MNLYNEVLVVSEIFCSIQGESSYTGLPCIFIRLSGCNLRCNYCDTKYSYESGEKFSINNIITKIKQYDPVKLVEITGGEPLLQSEVYELMSQLDANGYFVLLETNGSQSLKDVPHHVVKIIDVKCPDSGEGKSFLLSNLNFINKAKDETKFVLSSYFDYNWAKNFIFLNGLKNYKILFSAVSDRLDLQDLAKWITEDKLPVRMQIQLHKIIWDKDKKGV
ncbi:MAG: radical SAM protein [Candidatus Cloacimonetes bacterium]|nr:radical SAM protein [Candidatus Cloacimonadota bacterium]